MKVNHHHHHHQKQKQQYHHHRERCLKASSNRGERVDGEEAGGGERKEGAGPEHVDFVTSMAMIVDVINDNHYHHHWHDDHDDHLGGSGEGRACTVTSPTSSRPRQT